MNLRLLVGSLVVAAMAGTCALAGAQSVNYPIPYGAHPGQGTSNNSVWSAEHHLRGMIVRLERDDRDYGGHRVAALNAVRNAHRELLAAETYARGRGYGTPNTGYSGPKPPVPVMGTVPRRPPPQSNASVVDAQHAVNRIIRSLEGDSSDYGGHKGAALGQLHVAENELLQAERFVDR